MKKLLLLTSIFITGCDGFSNPDLQITIDPSARQFCESRAIGCNPIQLTQLGATGTITTPMGKLIAGDGTHYFTARNAAGLLTYWNVESISGSDAVYWSGKSVTLTYNPADFNFRTGYKLICGIPKDASGNVLWKQNIDATDTTGIVKVNIACRYDACPNGICQ